MTETLRVLFVEDNETDVKLVVRELRRYVPDVDAVRVEDGPAMRAALVSTDWDVVLSDWTLPRFSGAEALALLTEVSPEIPLIFVSGTVGEDLAVAAMQQGAADYVLKDRLGRLSVAVARAISARRARHAAKIEERARQAQLDAVARQLRESEERFRALIEHGWDSIVLFDRDGRTLYSSPTTTRILGYSPEELLGQSALDYVHPDDLAHVGKAMAECVARSETLSVVGRVRRKDGSYVELEGLLTNMLDVPAVAAMVVNYRDVTDRNRTLYALERSEARFRAYMANTPMLASLEDAAGRFVFVNSAWTRWYGEDRVVLGKTHHDLWPASIAETMEAEDRDVIDHREASDSEIELAGADGVLRTWHVFRFPVVEASGEILVGRLALDITESAHAHRALVAAQERLSRAVSAGNVGLWDWDLATNEVYYSPEWKRQIGYEPDEIGGSFAEWATRVHPDDLEQAKEAVEAYLAGELPRYEVEFRFRHKDGGFRNILAQASAVRGEDGRPRRLLGSHVDVTARAELQAQLLHVQKMESIGQLAGGIAHDFNNLLTVINTTAELAAADLQPDDPLRSDLQEIGRAGDRAAALTRQLLTFSRKQIVSPVMVSVAPLVDGLRKMLRRLIGEHIELLMSGSSAATVKADPGQLEQMIVNLAINARDAMPDGGRLTIDLCDVELDAAHCARHPGAQPGPYVRLSVGDSGTGMEEAIRSRVFEPFFTTKGAGRGTGLGLAIVHGVVAQSGGTISLQSEVGRGTTFVIHLPRVEAAPTRVAREVRISTGGALLGERIVLVEDEPAIRRLGARVLEAAGYRVEVARSGGDALLVFEHSAAAVHLLVTDVVMPGISGRDLADRLRVLHPQLKVLYTSGYTDDEIIRLGVLDDPGSFLPKPYTAIALTEKVRDILAAPRRGELT